MNYSKQLFSIILILLGTLSCQSEQTPEYSQTLPPEFEKQIPETQEQTPEPKYKKQNTTREITPPKLPRKIIYTANVSVLTYDPQKYHHKVLEELKKQKGYVQQEQSFNNNSEYHLTLKIPPENLFPFLEFVKKNADHLSSYNLSAQDITKEYYDLKRRIEVKKELEKQYLKILKKAERIPDILETQRYINSVRQEIEALQGQLKYYSRQTEYATVHLDISLYTADTQSFGEISFGMKISKAFHYGIELAEGIFLFLITIWPLYFVGPGIYFLVRFMRRKRKAEPHEQKSEPS